ncbi:N-Dimethylarginine dimethylaminohydrolase [Microlunatus flavus]|uniref:N-Dimethylarginine dimethylaminohydrolase n=2 Tax=Microlunatus flavus TaxID=1036181 RepID=A0A1H9NFX2_9ACTN|nr:N-Dimethylarginine dimethylaminohydrolase [Microlunatus flavus]
MCPPTFFDVRYAINPWMHPEVPVDRERALAQWSALVAAYERAGHRVDRLDPVPGLPDMVFAANGATVVDGRTLLARFATRQRAAEAAAHRAWHERFGVLYGGLEGPRLAEPVAVNEAEGDFAVLSSVVLAGHGFRTSPDAHAELAALTGREVVGLELVDPRFYHLDVALAVLDADTDAVAYFPAAFSPASQAVLAERFPDAVVATAEDALAFGLNAVGDGRNVFLPPGAPHLRAELEVRGFVCVEIDTSELLLGGGSVKCCTQEIRPTPARATAAHEGDPR